MILIVSEPIPIKLVNINEKYIAWKPIHFVPLATLTLTQTIHNIVIYLRPDSKAYTAFYLMDTRDSLTGVKRSKL